MIIKIEPFTAKLLDEITPLGQECWDECSEIKKDTCAFHGERGLKIEPNLDQYLYMASQNALIAMTLRNADGVMQGYALMVLYKSLHLRYVICGNVDSFFVQTEVRSSMPRFITAIEEEFKARGVSIVGWPVTMSGKLFEILKKRGYIADDVVMELKLRHLKEGASCA